MRKKVAKSNRCRPQNSNLKIEFKMASTASRRQTLQPVTQSDLNSRRMSLAATSSSSFAMNKSRLSLAPAAMAASSNRLSMSASNSNRLSLAPSSRQSLAPSARSAENRNSIGRYMIYNFCIIFVVKF